MNIENSYLRYVNISQANIDPFCRVRSQ